MLCPNTQAVTNGYSTGWGPRPFSPNRAEIWIWGLGKCIRKEEVQPHFSPRSLENWICGWGKWEKGI